MLGFGRRLRFRARRLGHVGVSLSKFVCRLDAILNEAASTVHPCGEKPVFRGAQK